MKKWTVYMLIISLLLFGSVIGFNMFKQKKIAEFLANRPEPAFPVTEIEVNAQNWVPIIQAIGFIEPKRGVTISSESNGVVEDIAFSSGAEVKDNQLLIALDTQVEEANLKAATARMPATKAKYERYKGLYQKGSVSKENFDDAAADFYSLAAEIESYRATIDRRQIRAPFSGVVGIRSVYLGQFLQAGTNIVRLEDTSVMKLRFTVSQNEISRINVGQNVDIFVDSYPEQTFEGTISAIEPAVSIQSGLIQVQANIPNSEGKLRSGMFARANIILPTKTDQIILPQTAVTYTLYGDSVYVIYTDKKENPETKETTEVLRVKQRVIKVGERKGDSVHILEGLKPGEQVITTGQVRLSNDAMVKVVESNATKTPTKTPQL
ncbi:efflux RND transporter periplasmic adaptor subunit [Vibrio sp.]|nr:efflux RND transporter periplasmic adaptor subunit [Vibrio sp.]